MAKLKPFSIEYLHNGKPFLMTFEAESMEDARRRMASAFYNGQPQEIVGRLDCPRWLAKAVGA